MRNLFIMSMLALLVLAGIGAARADEPVMPLIPGSVSTVSIASAEKLLNNKAPGVFKLMKTRIAARKAKEAQE